MSEPSRWIAVGELAQAFSPDNYAPSPSEDLIGRQVELHMDNGQVFLYRFEARDRLFWSLSTMTGRPQETAEAYGAVQIRSGIYLVDFVRQRERTAKTVLVLDLAQGIATSLAAKLPEKGEARLTLKERIEQGKELTAASATVLSGAINEPFSATTARHFPTDELIGKRIEYTYSPTEQYEHIYLNENFYTWHCLRGQEKGLADTDRCHYYKLAEKLYLFVWREKIIPTIGAVVVDLEALRTAGNIFGYVGSDYKVATNFPVGAHARLLSVTMRSD